MMRHHGVSCILWANPTTPPTRVMYQLIRQIFRLLTPAQRRQYYTLQLLVILMALGELLAIASIAPFMALVGDPAILQGENILATLYQRLGLTDPHDMILLSGITVLLALTAAALFSMYTTWRLAMFATRVGVETSDRLYSHYLKQPWLFHLGSSSAHLITRIANEAQRVTNDIIQPLMQLNAKLVMATLIALGIMLYQPLVALAGLALFATTYLILYRLVQSRLRRNGETVTRVATARYRLMHEGFGGIKDVLLLDRSRQFIRSFVQQGEQIAYALGNSATLSQIPRYLVELLAFGGMIAMVLILFSLHQGDLGTILPIVAVYALAGFKLLPAFQQIYHSIAQIKANTPAYYAIRADLQAAPVDPLTAGSGAGQGTPGPGPQQHIILHNITFSYPNTPAPVLNNLSMTIPARKVIGIVGPSGAGKTTAIDILLGLLQPQQGQLLIDQQPLTEQNRRAWQDQLGYVPQAIFLTEGSIAENVAFGIAPEQIDPSRLQQALQMAHLQDWIASLAQGVNTPVGERGMQLSGGQRQRIGIARALYHDPAVLVFDEATSALDGLTEKAIMDAIHDFTGKKTIILIAHRLNTVRQCDTLYLIDHGQLLAQGSYNELINTNEHFKRMAAHA